MTALKKEETVVSESKESDKKNSVHFVLDNEVDETWPLHKIVSEAAPLTWEAVFKSAYAEVKDIDDILQSKYVEYEKGKKQVREYYPLKKDIFRAFELTALQKVRVIIIGQDPYPQTLHSGLPKAIGLSFAIARNDSTIPGSLKNIYKELAATYSQFQIPTHGDLTRWALQGVLMLNMCLTVYPGEPESHKDIWLGFIKRVLTAIEKVNPYTVVLMLGKKAQMVEQYLGSKFIKITAGHPSGMNTKGTFFGSRVFARINEELEKLKSTPIDWRLT